MARASVADLLDSPREAGEIRQAAGAAETLDWKNPDDVAEYPVRQAESSQYAVITWRRGGDPPTCRNRQGFPTSWQSSSARPFGRVIQRVITRSAGAPTRRVDRDQ